MNTKFERMLYAVFLLVERVLFAYVAGFLEHLGAKSSLNSYCMDFLSFGNVRVSKKV